MLPSVFHHAVVFFDKRHARRTKTPSDGHSFSPVSKNTRQRERNSIGKDPMHTTKTFHPSSDANLIDANRRQSFSPRSHSRVADEAMLYSIIGTGLNLRDRGR